MGTCISYSNMSVDELLNEAEREDGELYAALVSRIEGLLGDISRLENGESEVIADLDDQITDLESDAMKADVELQDLRKKLNAIAELAEHEEA